MSFLGRFFGGPVELSGLYGIEHQRGDGLSIHPEAVGWLPVIEAVNNDAVERFGAAVAENKGYSLTVHYREVEQDTADEIMAWSERVSEEHGLHARSAKKSVELHPPISRNKGDAIADMLEGLSAAVYFGDDFGDRSGFERVLAAHGSGRLDVVATVLVNGAETPPELASVATDTVGSPGDVVALLNELSKACDEAP